MISIEEELKKYGLTTKTYESCINDIQAKMNGEYDIDWGEIVDKYNLNIHKDTLRKAVSGGIFASYFVLNYYKSKLDHTNFELHRNAAAGQLDYAAVLRTEREELNKERIKLRDERNDYQRSLRENARRESFLELVKRTMADEIQPIQTTTREPVKAVHGKKDMIVCLSDLHVGIAIDNRWNEYNIEVAQYRLGKYAKEIRQIQAENHCEFCDVVLGGDNISGLIHPNLRVENNENVIEQVKYAVELISSFIVEISDLFEGVRVIGVSGNHSRLSPNKEEHIKGEELDALILYCVKLKLSNVDNVEVCDKSTIDSTINSFATRYGKLFYLTHGDKDSPSNVIQKLTMLTGKKPDAIIMGHRHHNAYSSENGVKLIQVGSLEGVDDHCVDMRIGGTAEQCVIITDEASAVRNFYDINLQ